MFGLYIKVTLLFNVTLVVQGNLYRITKLLQDNQFKQHLNSDSIRSDYLIHENALKGDFDGWESQKKLQHLSCSERAVGNSARHGFFEKNLHIPVGKRQKCTNIKGLPTLESGCCGIEIPRFPGHQNDLNYPTEWFYSEYERVRRSIGSHTAPAKMIRGGKAIEPQHLPWMVRLIINRLETPHIHSPFECGGTIVSARYVLTAAHCLDDYKYLSQLKVFLSEYDTYSFPNDCINGQKCVRNKVMTVDQVIIHQDYNDTYLQNDIVLLRLSSNIPYTQFIRPICLPVLDIEDLQDKNIIIGGWGLNGHEESNLKQAALINYVANDKCKEQYSYKDESMFCSIGKHGEDTCHGDSGGPLMVFENNKYFLSGIISGKRKDHVCGSSVSSLFSNVFYHKDWIIKHVK